jgi:hypothetical protein
MTLCHICNTNEVRDEGDWCQVCEENGTPAPLSVTLEAEFLEDILELLCIGKEHAIDGCNNHDQTLGRSTRKNRRIGDMYDEDISRLQNAYAQLKGIIE